MGRLIGTVAILVLIALQVERCAPMLATWNDSSGGSSRDCRIKGNVSMYGGERIYHVPGGKWYDETRIDPGRGERWFCSEDEARAAGWRRSME